MSNVGTEKIKRMILKALKNHGASFKRTRYGVFADELANEIYGLIGGEMNLEWNSVHGFPNELEPLVRKLERGLGLRMKRDERAVEVYQWIREQGDERLKAFIKWATDPERARFLGKYRNSPEAIQIDYQMVGTGGNDRPDLEVGF